MSVTNEYECRYVYYTCIPVLRNIPIDLLHAHIILNKSKSNVFASNATDKVFFYFAINKTLFQSFRITDVDSQVRDMNQLRRLGAYYYTQLKHATNSLCQPRAFVDLGEVVGFVNLDFASFVNFVPGIVAISAKSLKTCDNF